MGRQRERDGLKMRARNDSKGGGGGEEGKRGRRETGKDEKRERENMKGE